MKKRIKTKKSIFSNNYVNMLNQIRSDRKSLGISQRELAERLGVHHSWVAKIELAERRVDIVELLRIYIAMDINPMPLIGKLYEGLKRLN